MTITEQKRTVIPSIAAALIAGVGGYTAETHGVPRETVLLAIFVGLAGVALGFASAIWITGKGAK